VPDAQVAALRSRVENAMAATTAALTSSAQQALKRSARYLRARPWQLVAVAATSAILVGFLMGGRSRRLTLRRNEHRHR
jgi:ElaB/YqjD/DUF883 family membrane-anchored ribosome-binding protein